MICNILAKSVTLKMSSLKNDPHLENLADLFFIKKNFFFFFLPEPQFS